jgi:sugar/nucleoside kinase (ribokinase family)
MAEGLLCVGLATVDILARPVESLPTSETVEIIDAIRLVPAGTAGGMALVARRLGVRTRLCSAVGADAAGKLARLVYQEHGVDLSLLATARDMPTSTTLLCINQAGRRPRFHMRGASMEVELGEAAFAAARDTKYLHYAGIGAPKLDGGAGAALAAAARKAGAIVTCDLISPRPNALDELRRVLPSVNLFMPNGDEALRLSGRATLAEAGEFFRDLGAMSCIIKDGPRGALIVEREGCTRVPAHAIEPVDTTSCGDSYCAGLVAALDQGRSVVESCRFASAVAALVASGLGTLGLLEGFEQADAFRQNTPVREVL